MRSRAKAVKPSDADATAGAPEGGGATIRTVSPLDIALAPDQHGAGGQEAAQRVLQKQERLIDAQTAQLGRLRWRDFIFTALGAGALAAAAFLVWDAAQASGVVAEPFAAPPNLVEHGLSGPVLASQLLDRLTEMQAETDSLRAASTYANDWGDDIAVEIPSTGVSIGELRRYLRDWLGRQTRLSGEVFRLADGRIAVTARVSGRPASRSEGAVGELDELLRKQAEAIYAETQPYRYSVWLTRKGRNDEARVVLNKLLVSKDLNDRLWAYNGLAVIDGTMQGQDRYYSAALRLRPDFIPAIFNRGLAFVAAGREEEAYRAYQKVLDHQSAARRELEPGRGESVINSARAGLATLVGDLRRAAEIDEAGIGLATSSANRLMAPMLAATSAALAHDLPSARRILREHGQETPEAQDELREALGPEFEIDSVFAAVTEDYAAQRDRLIPILAAVASYERDPAQSDPTINLRTLLAYAYARLGQIAEARATIAPTPMDCAPCLRRRGLTEAYAGDARAADRWLAQAAHLTPSLPAAHHDRAEAYLLRRDPANAIAQARLAVAKGPNWAEPHRLWGDALMMQNKPAEAALRYRHGLERAPNWGALHLALGRAQAAAGQPKAARESFRTASGLDLNPADRAAVNARLR